MKIYSLLIIFCFLNVIICDVEGVNQQSLQEAFTSSLKFINTFHQSEFTIPEYEKFSNLKLNLQQLNSNNVQFRFDEYGLLHIKFVNLKIQIVGNYKFNSGFLGFLFGGPFTADLMNFSWEHTVAVSSSKNSGKYYINFKYISESDMFYNLRFKLNNALKNNDISNSFKNGFQNNFKKFNLNNFKEYMKKIIKSIFNSLENNLNKV